ncbi:MAG: 50S ribosomal protein L5 [Parcubacteria group bacterium GW2011_GWC2_42_6]|nr:MAG: 50S ribosomal protein L5 [Parcubacteria group bacterium GW2011_GWC2_42_6]
MNRIKEKYQKEVIPAMKAKFGYRNDLAVPKITKVTVNSGIGKYRGDQKAFEEIEKNLGILTGQKAVYTKAKKAISSFKTRIGQPIGLKVTLRGSRMYDFIDRLISLALPRVRDFRGLEIKSVDSCGNLNIGIREQIVFPEISHENIKTIFGLEITLTVNAKNQAEGLELFRLLGFPIKKI